MATTSPTVGALTLAGQSPQAVVANVVAPSLIAASISGQTPQGLVDNVVTTQLVAISVSEQSPSLSRTYAFGQGSFILNANASTARIVNREMCDFSGFNTKPGELVSTDDGLLVMPEFLDGPDPDPRQYRPIHMKKGPLRPEPVNDETFIVDAVSAENL